MSVKKFVLLKFVHWFYNKKKILKKISSDIGS